jgi:hypothetical protein
MGVSLCWLCKHEKKGRACAAFPDGIPDEIYYGQHDHRRPYPGDNGTLFEMRDDVKGGYFDDLPPLEEVPAPEGLPRRAGRKKGRAS